MRRVVGGNAYRHAVADNSPDAETPHAAAKLGDKLLSVFKLDDKASAAAGLHDNSFKFRKVIFRHLFKVTRSRDLRGRKLPYFYR